jgi:hypothetical protein
MCGAVTCTNCTMTTIGMCRNCGKKVNSHIMKD